MGDIWHVPMLVMSICLTNPVESLPFLSTYCRLCSGIPRLLASSHFRSEKFRKLQPENPKTLKPSFEEGCRDAFRQHFLHPEVGFLVLVFLGCVPTIAQGLDGLSAWFPIHPRSVFWNFYDSNLSFSLGRSKLLFWGLLFRVISVLLFFWVILVIAVQFRQNTTLG